ncbi:MAG: hypothetical protein KGZ56_01080 [Dethiobacter sp.]|nr:hypothetical protein [Dethiobacter sp.]MBS3898726.1 hypothetical protein [Dethiobacter sp.]
MTSLEIAVAKHEQQLEQSSCRLKRIEEKLDRLHTWLIGVLGGVVASLVLLILNLGARR